MRSGALFAGILLAAQLSCEHPAPDATPEGAGRELLDRLERAEANPVEVHAVYQLLSASTRTSLDERARRASSAIGRPMSGADMIAPSRFALHFKPRQMHAHIEGDRSVVEVVGIAAAIDHASVPCVLEGGRWRVEIAPPPLYPTEFRPDGGS
jgi:hypothetical protein